MSAVLCDYDKNKTYFITNIKSWRCNSHFVDSSDKFDNDLTSSMVI
jgi:hypothetical protein